MDELTKELRTFLVRLHYEPSCVSDQVVHYLEHLVRLLPVSDEEAVLHYFGILGHEQQSLDELAQARSLTPEAMLEQINSNLRKLAITPEWQMVKQFTGKSA